jgi:hypothetical protein
MVDATVRTWFRKVQSLRFESFMAAVVHAAVDTTGDGERPYKAWFRSAAGSNSRPIHYPVKSRKRPINLAPRGFSIRRHRRKKRWRQGTAHNGLGVSGSAPAQAVLPAPDPLQTHQA